MGCQRSINGRFLGCMIASMLVLTGCIGSAREKDEPKVWSGVESCVLLSVDNSFGGHQWVCSDGTDTYFFKAKGIYRMGDEKNELICETSDVVLCMATDGERIIYGTDDNKLWEYDIRTKSLDCKNETLRVWQAASWDKNVFLLASEPWGDNYYRISDLKPYDYSDGTIVCLSDLFDVGSTGLYENKGMSYKCYCDEIVAKNNSEQLSQTTSGVVFFRDDVVCEVDSYGYRNSSGRHRHKGWESYGDHIFYLSQYSEMIDDKYLLIAQYYSLLDCIGYQEDRFEHPDQRYKTWDGLYAWDIEAGTYDVIYDTHENGDWIVSYTDDLKYCLIMKTDGLYKVAVDGTEDDELVWNAEGCFNVAVETLDGVVYIFTDEDEVRLVGKVDIREEAANTENLSVSSAMCDDINR